MCPWILRYICYTLSIRSLVPNAYNHVHNNAYVAPQSRFSTHTRPIPVPCSLSPGSRASTGSGSSALIEIGYVKAFRSFECLSITPITQTTMLSRDTPESPRRSTTGK